MIRSYRFRIQMSNSLWGRFDSAMAASNQIYNAALEERIQAWQKTRKSITKFDQMKSLTVIRKDDYELGRYAYTMLRSPIIQVDEAFKAFFSKLKIGKEKVGYPRFRSFKSLKSFGFNEAIGWKLKGKVLSMKGLPNVRLKMHREIEGKPLRLTIKKNGRGQWYAIIAVKLPDIFGPVASGAIGLDLGVTNQVTNSDGAHY